MVVGTAAPGRLIDAVLCQRRVDLTAMAWSDREAKAGAFLTSVMTHRPSLKLKAGSLVMEDLIEAAEQTDGPRKNIMVVGRRRNSAELEALEAAGMAYNKTLAGRLPIPFRDQDGKIELPGDYAIQVLKELGITPQEYMELVSS
jgi:hypothetical protein